MENQHSQELIYSKIRWRAKVYRLQEDGEWEDHGTGYAEIFENVSKLIL